MSTDRRDFLKDATLLAAAGFSGMSIADSRATRDESAEDIPMSRQGPKPVVRGKRAVASSQSPIVTKTMSRATRLTAPRRRW